MNRSTIIKIGVENPKDLPIAKKIMSDLKKKFNNTNATSKEINDYAEMRIKKALSQRKEKTVSSIIKKKVKKTKKTK